MIRFWVAAISFALFAASAWPQTPAASDDPESVVAEGDRLLQSGHPGEGIGVYRRALQMTVKDHGALSAKISAAEALRQGFLGTCETSVGTAGRHACEAAWLPGAPDEARVFRRRGIIDEAERQPEAALDAYMSAARLQPGDLNVAAAILRLSETTGRADFPGLVAKGSALITLGRHADAVRPLRLALRFNPDSVEVKALLRAAVARAANTASPGALPTTLESSASDINERRYTNSAPVTQSH